MGNSVTDIEHVARGFQGPRTSRAMVTCSNVQGGPVAETPEELAQRCRMQCHARISRVSSRTDLAPGKAATTDVRTFASFNEPSLRLRSRGLATTLPTSTTYTVCLYNSASPSAKMLEHCISMQALVGSVYFTREVSYLPSVCIPSPSRANPCRFHIPS